MEEIKTDYKRRLWKIWARHFKLREPWPSPLITNSYRTADYTWKMLQLTVYFSTHMFRLRYCILTKHAGCMQTSVVWSSNCSEISWTSLWTKLSVLGISLFLIVLIFFFFLQPASEMKANLQFHLRIFVVLFKCLDPDSVENHPHPVSMWSSLVKPISSPYKMDVMSLCLQFEQPDIVT